MEEALKAGGLDWEVGTVPLATAEEPSSPVPMRVAIVRKDTKPGSQGRVLGVTHTGFRPLQNREGIEIFDSIFGKGERVYHTGGYLGDGEVIWVLARLPKEFNVAKGDTVKTYVLFTNSHNGSIAIDFRLTTVRVVCQNTLSLALKKDTKTVFKHAHQGSYTDLKDEVEIFFKGTLKAADDLREKFKMMLERRFDDDRVKGYVETLFPIPGKPAGAERNSSVMGAYLARVKKVESARKTTLFLARNGKGTELETVKGSLWAALNGVLEYVDHYEPHKHDPFAYALFGSGAMLKRKAFNLAVTNLQP